MILQLRNNTILISLLWLLTYELPAQEIIFCRHLTATGEPIGQIHNRKIYTNEAITILLTKNNVFTENIIYISINLREKNTTKNIVSTLIRPDKNKNWLSYNYKFSYVGTYEIHFKDYTHKIIASALLLVTQKEVNVLSSTQTIETKPDLKIIFCSQVINNKPYRFHQNISIDEHGGETYLFLLHNRPFDTKILQLRIWRKLLAGAAFDDFIDYKKFSINPSWYDTFFKYRFAERGEYKIDFFDEKDLLLKTAYISVH